MAPGHQPMVKKPRSKVSRACENCRRRKIKCTGNQPCSNCVAYQCGCIFSKGVAPAITSISQITPANSEKLASSISSGESLADGNCNGSSCPLDIDPSTEKDNAMKSAPDAYIFDPVMDCVSDNVGTVAGGLYRANALGDTRSKEECDVGLAASGSGVKCDICESKAKNLAALPDIKPVKGDNGLYEDDMDFQEKIGEIQAILKRLTPLANVGPNVRKAINILHNQAESLINTWEPKYHCETNDKIANSGIEHSKSLETHLMKNKYTDQVFLTSYAFWTDNSKKKTVDNPFFGNRPLIDELFGLYSPLQGLSLRGIGYFFQLCTSRPNSKEKSMELKESLYLLLRFFDICVDHINQSCISIANPLVSYLQRRNLLGTIPVSTPSGLSPASTCSGNKDLLLNIIDRLPQPFVQKLTGVSNEMLRQTMYDDFAMFDLVLKMYDCHKKGFESLMMKVTSRDGAESVETRATDTESFMHFCEEEEMLLALCYNYYNSTMYHFNENAGNLIYFELLLSLLETQKWLFEFYGFEKVLGIAISYAYNIGLSRWEFYVGLDEETAERKRRSWWKLYCQEKLFAFRKGRQSSIDDDRMNCLLPAEFRSLGFTDSKSFLAEVASIPSSWAFDNMSIESLIFYGECALAQVGSHFYNKVLYADRFTSIKNTAKPTFMKERLIIELFQELHLMQSRFDAIKAQTKRLFEVAATSATGATNLLHSKNERAQAAHYALTHGSLYFAVATSANNLVARLLSNSKDSFVSDHYSRYSEYLRQSWKEMTELLLSLDDDYTLSRVFEYYGAVSSPMVSPALCDSTFCGSSEELIMFCRVFQRLQNITLYQDNKDNETVALSKAYQIYVRTLTFLAINIHSMMLGFLHINNMSRENLIENVKQWAPDVADVPSVILNPKSSVYEPLMKPVQKSGFHLNVRRMLERNKDNSKAHRLYPKTAFQLMPNSAEQSTPGFSGPGVLPTTPGRSSFGNSPYFGVTTGQPVATAQGVYDASQLVPQEPFANSSHTPRQEVGANSLHIPQPNPAGGALSNDGYNLGTLDEFINNGDLNELCNTLWSDLYAETSSVTLRPSDYSGSGQGGPF